MFYKFLLLEISKEERGGLWGTEKIVLRQFCARQCGKSGFGHRSLFEIHIASEQLCSFKKVDFRTGKWVKRFKSHKVSRSSWQYAWLR